MDENVIHPIPNNELEEILEDFDKLIGEMMALAIMTVLLKRLKEGTLEEVLGECQGDSAENNGVY